MAVSAFNCFPEINNFFYNSSTHIYDDLVTAKNAIVEAGNNCITGIQNFWNDHSETVYYSLDIAKKVTQIAIVVLASAALIAYTPYVFVGGLFLGAIFKDELAPRIDYLVDLWNTNLAVKVAMVALGALTWPLTLELLALWAGARWSVYLLS